MMPAEDVVSFGGQLFYKILSYIAPASERLFSILKELIRLMASKIILLFPVCDHFETGGEYTVTTQAS